MATVLSVCREPPQTGERTVQKQSEQTHNSFQVVHETPQSPVVPFGYQPNVISGAYEPPKAARSVQLRIMNAFAFTVARSFYHKRISEISYQLRHLGCVH